MCITQFVYDGDGRRVKSTINGVTTYFIGAHYEVTGSQVTKYYFAGSQRIAMTTYTVPQNPTLRYLLTDHLGSTSLVTDPSGGLLSRQLYKAWGETRYTSGALPTKYTYTGQYSYTSDFGLHFYNARWYDSLTGRFAQADTIIPAGVQGLDRYAYVGNSPVVYIDPSGHECASGIFSHEECESATSPQGLLIFETEGNMKWTEAEIAGFNDYAMDVAQKYADVANTYLHIQCMAAENTNNEPCDSVTPTDAFYAIHDGPVTVVRKSQSCADAIGHAYPGCTAWGFAASPNEIWVFSNATPNTIASHPQLIVHELGHAFSQSGSARGFGWVYDGLSINRSGFYGDAYSWQLSTDMAASEIYADMFLGWTYGKWDVDEVTGALTTYGKSKAEFMNGTNTFVLMLLGLYP